MWLVYALFSALFAGFMSIFAKLGLKNIDSTLATTLRSFVMAIFLFLVSLSLDKFKLLEQCNICKKDLLIIIASGIVGAISWLFYFLALKNGPTTAVAALDKLSLVFVFLLSILILKEKITVTSLVGLVLMIGGAILLSYK